MWQKFCQNKLGWREIMESRGEAPEKFLLTISFRLSENVGNALIIYQYYYTHIISSSIFYSGGRFCINEYIYEKFYRICGWIWNWPKLQCLRSLCKTQKCAIYQFIRNENQFLNGFIDIFRERLKISAWSSLSKLVWHSFSIF